MLYVCSIQPKQALGQTQNRTPCQVRYRIRKGFFNMNDYSRWKQKFLTIAAGQTVSLIGSSAVQFSLIWWLASETGSPMMMALSGLVAFLPQIFLGPFAGVWIDRLKRKHVAIAATGLPARFWAFGPWEVYSIHLPSSPSCRSWYRRTSWSGPMAGTSSCSPAPLCWDLS